MKKITTGTGHAICLMLCAMLASAPALADRDHGGRGHEHEHGEHGDRGKQGKHKHKHKQGKHDDDRGRRHYFGDDHKMVVRDYYGHPASGRCPPGLAKRHNGCLPPGHAKKWRMGQPLPREVVYYPVPPVLVTQIGPPPSRHKYVRVAGDILLIAIGTGMVVDAIEDLGRI
jgi:Ni/Co efflux regulator RcnB